jgi:prefoldin subunit 5
MGEGDRLYCESCLEKETDRATEAERKYAEMEYEFETAQNKLDTLNAEHQRVQRELHDLKTNMGMV